MDNKNWIAVFTLLASFVFCSCDTSTDVANKQKAIDVSDRYYMNLEKSNWDSVNKLFHGADSTLLIQQVSNMCKKYGDVSSAQLVEKISTVSNEGNTITLKYQVIYGSTFEHFETHTFKINKGEQLLIDDIKYDEL